MAVSPFLVRWSVAEAAVRPNGVVVPTPSFDQHLDLGEAVEDLAIEELVPQGAVDPKGGEAKLSF